MTITFCPDFGPAIGTGHLMRCLALAKAAALVGARCRFVIPHVPATWRKHVTGAGHEAIDSAEDGHSDWIVIDHYGRDGSWERGLRPHCDRLLVIDDLANRPHACDVLSDPGFHVEGDYRPLVPPTCRLLLGPRFAVLRPEFEAHRARAHVREGPPSSILIQFGGTDPGNLTGRAVAAIRRHTGARMDVIAGSLHPALRELEAMCDAHGATLHVQTDRVGECMARSDFTVGAAGSTSWERCCMGLPALAFPVADNQVEATRELARRGALIVGDPEAPEDSIRDGWERVASGDRLERMSRAAFDIVDGRGAQRVLSAMTGAGGC